MMAFLVVVIILLTSITTGYAYSKIGQSLTAIPSDIPAETISVNLTANSILQITDSDFIVTIFIEELDLTNNLLGTISNKSLTPLAQLKKLYMSGNRFTRMPPLEAVSVTIKELKLDKNQITSLKTNYFTNFINLTLLHLNENLILTLQENAFLGLSNLVKLRLDYNQLTCINRTLLDGMTMLEYLDISYNQLTGFLSESCPFVANETTLTPAQLPNLHSLNLKENILTEVPDLRGAHMLYYLRLDYNQLTDIRLDHLATLSKLRHFFINYNCNLNHFPNLSLIFNSNANSLNFISANNIGISVIDDGIFANLVHLQIININRNMLQSLSFLFMQKAVIKLINMSNNKLQNLNSMELATGSWEKLVKIYVRENKITHISNVLLDQFPALKTLELSNNRISVLPELTRIGASLEKANFNTNNISWVDVSSLNGLSNILHLNLNENILTTFPLSVFSQVSTIRGITLANNHITNVEELSPDVMASTDLEVTLTDNPFNCDQYMVWIKKLNSPKLTMTLSPKPCASPASLTNIPWAYITADDLGISKIFSPKNSPNRCAINMLTITYHSDL